MKRLLAVITATALILGMASPAFADSPPPGQLGGGGANHNNGDGGGGGNGLSGYEGQPGNQGG